MAKLERSYRKKDGMTSQGVRLRKIQEFLAHEASVNCLALGHVSGKVLVTGGYDGMVNLWAIGASTPLISKVEHCSPVECVKFGHTEEFVCSGSQAGEINIWDLEANKKVRNFSGHKDAVRCLDFHPYGDFLSSGSLDTSVKFWDLRRKGVLSSYRGHTLTVNRVRFSPDGLWVASAGEDGVVKLWDVRMGKKLTDFVDHEAAVLTAEFHPHEFLLTSGSMDRTVKFWDLESFQNVSCTPRDASPIRCLRFSPEGRCLFAGVKDQLKVYTWEPGRLLDSVAVDWGQVQDIVHCQNELVGASFHKTMVKIMAVEVSGLRTKPEPNLAFPGRGSNARKSFSKEKLLPATFTVKPSIESERSGPDTEDERVDTVTAPFQAQRTLNRTPPPVPDPEPEPAPITADRASPLRYNASSSEPEPLSLSSLESIPRPMPQTARSPSPKRPVLSPVKARRHSTSLSNDQRRQLLPDKVKPPSYTPRNTVSKYSQAEDESEFPVKMNNIRHSPSEPTLVKSPPARPPPRKTSLSVQTDSTPLSSLRSSATGPPSSPSRNKPVLPVRPSPAASPAYYTPPQTFQKLDSTMDDAADRLGGVNIEDFLPKSASLSNFGSVPTSYMPNYSEDQVLNTLMPLHNSFMLALNSRQRNLQVVFNTWHNKDARAATDLAVNMNDDAVIADLLGVFILRPACLNLDICGSVLPPILGLLQSKYEAYMNIGCSALSIILRNFAHIIKNNILAPIHTVGVDISREERYNKSMKCYNSLVSIRAFLLKRQTVPGKLGQNFRELLILMENLEN